MIFSSCGAGPQRPRRERTTFDLVVSVKNRHIAQMREKHKYNLCSASPSFCAIAKDSLEAVCSRTHGWACVRRRVFRYSCLSGLLFYSPHVASAFLQTPDYPNHGAFVPGSVFQNSECSRICFSCFLLQLRIFQNVWCGNA
jgi:hypothetical protein